MSKFLTAARLLASGNLRQIRNRARINHRGWHLRRAQGRPFTYRLGGIPFVCFPGIPDSEETYLTGESDELELMLLRHWLQPGDGFIDVGANLGMYSFAACHFLRGQGVFLAIEASPELHGCLEAAAKLLGCKNLTLEQMAAGDSSREIAFYIAPAGKSRGEQSLHPDPVRSADYVPCRVQMSTLAEIVHRHPSVARPAAVKLDIEGAEPLALGAAPPGWFTPTGPLVIVEINPSALARNSSSCSALVTMFPPNAFECWLFPQYGISGARHLPLRPLSGREQFTDAWFYNLIAVPLGAAFASRRERIQSILARARQT